MGREEQKAKAELEASPQEGSGTIVADGGAAKGTAESNIPVLVFSTTRTGAMARRELLMLIATSTWRRRRC